MDERLRATLDTYEDVADRYATIHDDRSVVADIVERFLDALGAAGVEDPEARRVLDVGCGPGWETATFAARGLDSVGLDLSPSFLADARERAPAAAFVRADMRSLPVASDRFDGLWACASLLHVPRAAVPETLAEFHRVLVADGVVALAMKRANPETTRESPYDEDDRHFERYEPETLRGLVADAGFDVVDGEQSERWYFLLARAWAAYSVSGRTIPKNSGASSAVSTPTISASTSSVSSHPGSGPRNA